MQNKYFLFCVAISANLNCLCQMSQFDFKRELINSQNQWQQLVLTDVIFKHLSSDFSDLRIFGINSKNDTIEVPYILQIDAERKKEKATEFKIINESKNDKGTFYTFKISNSQSINKISIDLDQQNFDLRLRLEGSQNQNDWYTIADDYRILSIKNEATNYKFNKIIFPTSQYNFYRLFIASKEKIKLGSAKIFLNETEQGSEKKYEKKSIKIETEKLKKQTVIYAELNSKVPIDKLSFSINKKFDFYRPLTVEIITDSVKTEKGWMYNYAPLATGLLNSVEKNEFQFKSTLVNKLKITIENNDNNPLQIDSVSFYGSQYQMKFRITDAGKYYLVYGNKQAKIPTYDLQLFADKIPLQLKTLAMGNEQIIDKLMPGEITPLFENKIILWSVMGIVIILLGWFSLSMIKKK